MGHAWTKSKIFSLSAVRQNFETSFIHYLIWLKFVNQLFRKRNKNCMKMRTLFVLAFPKLKVFVRPTRFTKSFTYLARHEMNSPSSPHLPWPDMSGFYAGNWGSQSTFIWGETWTLNLETAQHFNFFFFVENMWSCIVILPFTSETLLCYFKFFNYFKLIFMLAEYLSYSHVYLVCNPEEELSLHY